MKETTQSIPRRSVVLALAAWFIVAGTAAARANAFPAAIQIELPAVGKGAPAQPGLLGNNVQWSNDGDGLVRAGTLELEPVMLQAIRKLKPTTLRYPGGTLADVYHWKNGVGERTARGRNYLVGAPGSAEEPPSQSVTMGTPEFLELCEQTGARPLISVNVITGTAQEAAEWVRQTNITRLRSRTSGRELPRVDLWEIGNEPYLTNSDKKPDRDISPADFGDRANEFIAAMKAVDPSIKILLPFRNAKWGQFPVTPYPDYNAVLFGRLQHAVDYVAIHNAYAPGLFLSGGRKIAADDLFRATMSASRTVAEDLAATQTVLDRYPLLAHASMAVTEYAPLYSLTMTEVTDSYIATLAGALYVADVLRVFAATPKVEMAQYWSLAGNWHFGAISPGDPNGNPRPVYWSLYAFRQLLHGEIAPVSVTSPTFDSPDTGFAPAQRGTPTVAAVATLADGRTLRLLVINKDATDRADLTISPATDRKIAGPIRCQTLSGASCFAYAKDVTFKQGTLTAGRFPLKVTLPPHAFVLLEIPLQ